MCRHLQQSHVEVSVIDKSPQPEGQVTAQVPQGCLIRQRVGDHLVVPRLEPLMPGFAHGMTDHDVTPCTHQRRLCHKGLPLTHDP